MFEKFDQNLRALMNRFKPYGGINIILAGDLHQLTPVKGTPVYLTDCPEFHDKVNCYIELNGMHRYKDDPKWGKLLHRFRTGNVTLADIRLLNERCIHQDDGTTLEIPHDIQTATHRNSQRDAINTGVFEQYCESNAPADTSQLVPNTIIVLMADTVQHNQKKKTYEPIGKKLQERLWTKCGENYLCSDRNVRTDPALKLYHGCDVMLNDNSDVKGGMANGTVAKVIEVQLKPGETAFIIELANGNKVMAVQATQVQYVTLEHTNPKIRPAIFKVEPKQSTFNATIPLPAQLQLGFGKQKEVMKMKGIQLPFGCNNATTGHKLQGATLTSILVHEWCYEQNWPYVVLSRVTTMSGLYIREPLSEDLKKYRSPPELHEALQRLRVRCPATEITTEKYQAMMNTDIPQSTGANT